MQYYNTPPPRRGFTYSMSASPTGHSPVVTVLTGSNIGRRAVDRAAEEAAQRSRVLHVIIGRSAKGVLSGPGRPAEGAAALPTMLRSKRVAVFDVEESTADVVLDHCRRMNASLLVVGCDELPGTGNLDANTTHRLVDEADCDVMVVHPQVGVTA